MRAQQQKVPGLAALPLWCPILGCGETRGCQAGLRCGLLQHIRPSCGSSPQVVTGALGDVRWPGPREASTHLAHRPTSLASWSWEKPLGWGGAPRAARHNRRARPAVERVGGLGCGTRRKVQGSVWGQPRTPSQCLLQVGETRCLEASTLVAEVLGAGRPNGTHMMVHGAWPLPSIHSLLALEPTKGADPPKSCLQ